MGIMDFIKGELIDVIEWTDDSRDTLSYRFPDEDKAIKNNAQLMTLCGQQVPGDTFRNLQIDPDYSGQTFKHVLVPIWMLTYTFGAKTFQVVANGYTGVIAGHYPKSFWKIAFVVVLVLIAIALFALAKN
ncbi:MAG: hypothetical protein AABY89_02960 [Acidobacteriota bacterium]